MEKGFIRKQVLRECLILALIRRCDGMLVKGVLKVSDYMLSDDVFWNGLGDAQLVTFFRRPGFTY